MKKMVEQDQAGTKSRWNRGVLAILLVMMIVLSACGSDGNSTQSEKQVAEDELVVLLDWYPNAVHSFLFAAEEQGYFKEAGLKVKLQTPADTNDALKLVAAGKADLAISYQMQVAISRAEEIPIVSVAAFVRHPLNQVFVSADSGVTSPKDLSGKKVGYPSIPLDQAIVNTMVEADGGDASSISYVDIGWDLIPAMSTGRVDAIIGGYINHEMPIMEKEGMKITAFDPSLYGVPDYYELVLTASESGLAANEDAIKRFIIAAGKGQQYVQDNPQVALQHLLDQQSGDFPLDDDIEKRSLDILMPLMDAGDEPFGSQSAASWQSVIDWLVANGQLTEPIPAEEAFRNLAGESK